MKESTKHGLAGIGSLILSVWSFVQLGGPAMLGSAMLGFCGACGCFNFFHLRQLEHK